MDDEFDDYDEPSRVWAPLFFAVTETVCWNCGATLPVGTLIATNVEGAPDSVFMIHGFGDMPETVVHSIQAQVPDFRRTSSKSGGYTHFGNHCPKCGSLTGDFYLFSEPGGPFCPETEQDAARIHVQEIAIPERLELQLHYPSRPAEFILANARR